MVSDQTGLTQAKAGGLYHCLYAKLASVVLLIFGDPVLCLLCFLFEVRITDNLELFCHLCTS